ncbi:MAG TPA: formate dehydrogenase subunit delta [Candidatus Binataceae bacterium]|nr:formate dehydrogenase subunit delta [Candidatus Binataceae bacterium]
MANQIGDYFAAYPDRDKAVKEIAQHLKNFWEPRMRREILAYLEQTGAPELNEPVRQAVHSLASAPPAVSR